MKRASPEGRAPTPSEAIQCPLCGHRFSEGQKRACQSCPLNYGTCHFEKCPNCGYDIPQGSYVWTAVETAVRKLRNFFKKGRSA